MKHLGVSPVVVAQTRRLLLARQLLSQTAMPLTDIALASGFRSIRRFNESFQRAYGSSPTELRRQQTTPTTEADICLLLPYRPPYDWQAMLDFLGHRALPGIEEVRDDSYRRTIRIGKET